MIYNTKKNAQKPWVIDLVKFRIYLREKYEVSVAYYFIGAYNEKYEKIYSDLSSYGFEVIFREHDEKARSGKKGNVDTDIVFLAMKKIAEREKFDKILLVSDDGDYFRMVDYMIIKGKFKKLLAPCRDNISYLYKTRIADSYIDYIDKSSIRNKIELKK